MYLKILIVCHTVGIYTGKHIQHDERRCVHGRRLDQTEARALSTNAKPSILPVCGVMNGSVPSIPFGKLRTDRIHNNLLSYWQKLLDLLWDIIRYKNRIIIAFPFPSTPTMSPILSFPRYYIVIFMLKSWMCNYNTYFEYIILRMDAFS